MAQSSTGKAAGNVSSSGERHGVVVKFDADRGFGFIRPDDAKGEAGQDVFVHISEVEGRQNLHQGQPVAYYVTQTEKGPAATRVQPGSVLRTPYLLYTLVGLGSALLLLFGLTMVLGQPQKLAVWGVLWVMALSLTSFFVYGYDKAQAQQGGPRVPEAVLHLLSLLGGSLGSFVAMRVFHHKTSKSSFQAVFWLIVAIQVGVIVYLLLR